MKKEKGLNQKKGKYLKPVLTKHRRLREVTANSTKLSGLGCTR